MKSDKPSSKKATSANGGPSKRGPGDAAKPKAPHTSAPIPSVLLEGDTTPAPAPSGPGQRYALGPRAVHEKLPAAENLGELPEAYGTKRLLLTARDPHWLYAHWDLTKEQLKKCNALSVDGHLVLRVFKDAVAGEPFTIQHVHPESRNWFVHVGRGGTKFLAELGYYETGGRWVCISTSAPTLTPPDKLSDDVSVWFETMPVDLQFDDLLRLVKSVVKENIPLIQALQQLRASGYRGLPAARAMSSAHWTPTQDRALGEIITMDSVRRVWMGSMEITELIRRQLLQEISSMSLAQFSVPGSGSMSVSSFSSPLGGMERRKGFWFNVNAELIIYGATEPDATVTMGGRVIKLRPDGTFSYRFILPDGDYDLPAIATSVDGDDSRSAALTFRRRTEYSGDVGKHPQDTKLKTPHAANVS